MATDIEILESYRVRLTILTRLNSLDNQIPKPDDNEMDRAILDGINDMNIAPPITNFTLQSLYAQTDDKWARLVLLFAAINVLTTLLFDWAGNASDLNLEEPLTLKSRYEDYKSLKDDLQEQLDKLLEWLLKTYGVGVRGFTASNPNPIISYYRRGGIRNGRYRL